VRYTVLIEQGPTSWGAYVPDLPGCVAVGESRAEVEALIREALPDHLAAMRAHGEMIPEPTTWAITLEVAAPANR
jgi:predicted RNase H-like HicB family nuclease